MQVRILGPVDVLVNGTPREVRGLRRKAVLAVLALNPGEIVSADRLIDLVWAEKPPATASNTLQRTVSHLRGVLGGRDTITARPPGYVLHLGADATDLQVAHRLIGAGTRSTDPAERAAHLRAALALWRDRPLVDVAGLAWLDDQAERLVGLRLEAVETLTEARLALGEHVRLIPELERRCREHPFRERAHGQLVLALYRAGRQVDALAVCRRLRRTLGEEFGIDPSPALRDLEAAVLRQDGALDPHRTVVEVTTAVRPDLLEREHEIAELAAAAREAAAGAGSVVLLPGAAGIGKSSLVEALRGVLRGVRLLVGCCDDLATPRVLGPFRDLAGSVGAPLAAALRAGGDQVFDALHEELGRSPAVLAVEDLHWADEATLDALSYLVRRIADLPAVLVLTYRDDLEPGHPLHRVLGLVAKAPRVRRLEPARLSEAAVRRLATPSRLDPHEVFAVTGGNPFFVTEVLAAGSTAPVPPTITDAVLARLRDLDAETRAALDQLAVIPSAVGRRLLDVLPGGIAALASAERRGLLAVSPSHVGFRHELIRRAIADALPVAHRVELNRRVLTALIGQDETDLSRIVHHAAEAGEVDAIVRYAPPAAREATRAGSHREAAAHLRLVLRHRDRFGPAERADLLGRYAIECGTVGETAAAVAAQQEAVELRRTLRDRGALGHDLHWLSRLCWMAGRPDLVERTADEAVAVLEGAGDDRRLALALSHRSTLHTLAYRNRDGIRIGERAIALARAVGDPAVLSYALASVGGAQGQSGLPAAEATLAEGLAVALAAGSVGDVCRVTCALVSLLLRDLRHADAMRHVTAAIGLAEGAEQLRFLYHMHAYRAMVALASGAWDQAVSDAELVLGVTPAVKPPTRCPALTVLGRVRVRVGDPTGEALLADAGELARRTRELQNTGPVAAAQAEAAWLRDDEPVMVSVLEPAYADACRLGAVALRAELGYWMTKAGRPVALDDSDHPYAVQTVDPLRAAALWQAAGCSYEYAAALAESTDRRAVRTALTTLDALGAAPLARRVRARHR